MNKIYKVIWNEVRHCYVVASEFAKGHSKSKSGIVKSRPCHVGRFTAILTTTILFTMNTFSMALVEAFEIHDSIPNHYQDWSGNKFNGLAYSVSGGEKYLNILLGNNKYVNGGTVTEWVNSIIKDETLVKTIVQQAPESAKDVYTYTVTSQVTNKAPSSGATGSIIKDYKEEYTLKTLKNGTETGDTQTFTDIDTDTHANVKSATLNGQKLTVTDTDDKSAEVDLSGLYKSGNGVNITGSTVAVKAADTNSGLNVGEDGVKVVAKNNGGITIDDQGLSVDTAAIKDAIDTDTHATLKSASLSGQQLTVTDTDNATASVDLSGLYTAGAAVSISNGTVGVKTTDTNSGLSTADGLKVVAKENGGITIDENGLSVNTAAIKSAIDTNTVTTVKNAENDTSITIDASTDANGNKTYVLKANAAGTIADGVNSSTSGDTVYHEVRPKTDGNYVKTNSTTGDNLLALDKQVKDNTDNITNINSTLDGAVMYDKSTDGTTVDKTKVTLGGQGGTTITNLKAGELSKNSKDAVNGSQLFATNQNVTTNATNIATNTKNITTNTQNIAGNTSKITKNTTDIATNTTNITNLTTTVEKGLNFTGDDTTASVNKKLGDTLTIKGGATELADNNIGVVKDTDGSLAVKLSKSITGLTSITSTNITGDDVTVNKTVKVGGDGGVTINKNSITNVTEVTNDNDVTNKKYVDEQISGHAYTAGDGINISNDRKISAVAKADGGVEVTTDGIGIKTGTTSGLKLDANGVAVKAKADGGITIDADGLSVNQTYVQGEAKKAVKVIDGTNTTVTTGTDGDATTYAVNVTTNGTVAKDDKGVVSGDTVYNYFKDNALRDVSINNTDATNTKDDVNYENGGATGSHAVAIGVNASAVAKNSIAIGNGASVTSDPRLVQKTGEGSIVIGDGATTYKNYAIVIGSGATAKGDGAVALGRYADAEGGNSVAFGGSDKVRPVGTKGEQSGHNVAAGDVSTAFGVGNEANGKFSTAFGIANKANGDFSTVFGQENVTGTTSRRSEYDGLWATAFGYKNKATGTNSTVWGAGNEANGLSATAWGEESKAYGEASTALGFQSTAYGPNSLAALGGTTGDKKEDRSRGTTTYTGLNTVAIGRGAAATKDNAMAFGQDAQATIENGIALGNGAVTTNSGKVAGYDVTTKKASLSKDIAWTSTAAALAIGSDTVSRQITGVAAGSADTDAVNVAQLKKVNELINTTAAAATDYQLVAKAGGYKADNGTITLDVKDSKHADAEVKHVTITDVASKTVVDGHTADITNLKDLSNITDAGKTVVKNLAKDAISIEGDDNVIVTQDENDKGKYTLKLGDVLKIGSGASKVTIDGEKGHVTGLTNKDWTVGQTTFVSGRAATEDQLKVVSDAVKTQGDNLSKATFGLSDGKDSVTANLNGTVTVTGDGNITTKADGNEMKVSLNQNVNVTSITTGDTTVNTNGVSINNDAVTVTKDGLKIKDGPSVTKNGVDAGGKQITNVASGGDLETNAANIGDVNRIAKDEANKASEAVRAKSGKNITVGADNTVNLNDSIELNGTVKGLTNKDWQVGETKAVVGQAATEDQLQVVSDEVAKGTNFGGDSGTAVNVKLGETLHIKGGITDESKLSDGNIGVVAKDGALNVKLAKDVKLAGGSTTYTQNTNLHFTDGSSVQATTIVNGSGMVTALTDKDGKAVTNPVSVTPAGLDNGGNQIHHVAPGTAADDAATVGQLGQTNNAIRELGSRVDHVGAGAAALAALQPLDFDPDNKWDFSAGYGNYSGAHATAIGAFYRPDEKTMFSIGGSFGGGENMVNAGVTFKLGRTSKLTSSKVVMARQIEQLQARNESLETENKDLKDRMAAMEKKVEALLKATGLAEK